MIVGVILAAGLGSRFGGDKLLHPLPNQKSALNNAQADTQTHLAMGLQSALNLAPYVDEVVCVVRPEDKVLTELFTQHGFKACVSEDYQKGLSASFMAGVKASDQASMWWIALGDMPFIQETSYHAIQQQALLQAQKPESDQKIVRPYSITAASPKPGHPVVFPKRLKAQLLNLKGDEGAKAILKSERDEVQQVLLKDKGIHLDIDELSDLKDLCSHRPVN